MAGRPSNVIGIVAIQAFEQELGGRVAFTALQSVPAPFEHSLLRVGVDEVDDRSTDEVVWPLDAGHVQRCLIGVDNGVVAVHGDRVGTQLDQAPIPLLTLAELLRDCLGLVARRPFTAHRLNKDVHRAPTQPEGEGNAGTADQQPA